MTSFAERKKPISPEWDPWDAWYTRSKEGRYRLTSVEFTVTNLCNLRCEHCAVGEALVEKEGVSLPVEQLIRQLEKVEDLQTLSITGGEPIVNRHVVDNTIRPLLQYAKQRGIYTQLNSNLTLPLSRYEDWIEDIDVLHISYNYRDEADFQRMAFANANHQPSATLTNRLFQRLKDNAIVLSKAGVFISAETFLSPFTAPHLPHMHKEIAEMGCKRHEVHPLYPSDFAKGMKLLSVDEYKAAIENLLNDRDPAIWILFGTLPIYPCSHHQSDQDLWLRLFHEPNITVRQDPDGRNRLNINAFTGDVIVTDFADVPPLGNIKTDSLTTIFDLWLDHPLAKKYHCYCPKAHCTGPNLLVANTYYQDVDFQARKAHISV
ncbi:radical SAM/CxCxxxxC motif protein YfkAB [Seinonella peptonophila]|uniref:Radical SAM/CxCxxxxC motif protein YfkAB n=1 Tax=Seinonella peptonophila TaxID=112248 RepID=A0A1M4V1Q1_9BACL|nr:radical SAM/CxCxxxxC motif protein YfkAB [Seinonella peptonophila]SHE62817.1 radical SAM/CxCxxxxC motif protein YfkAB [Seinonella peptonophila]